VVQKIRNRALHGISKSDWKSKYYFLKHYHERIVLGLSLQEFFEPNSSVLREGATQALSDIAETMERLNDKRLEVALIDERIPGDEYRDTRLSQRQLSIVFSYLCASAYHGTPEF